MRPVTPKDYGLKYLVYHLMDGGWSLRNFERIASFWGKLICLETSIDDTVSFDSMKILIESKSFQDVVGHIILQIGDAGHRILVKEASCSININPLFIAPERSSTVKETSRQPVINNDDDAIEDEEGKKFWCDANRMDGSGV